MLLLIANLVDNLFARVMAALVGMLAILFLCLFIVLIAFSQKTNWMLAVGAGGFIGLIGWWVRVFVSLRTLTAFPLLRWLVCGSLLIGIAAMAFTVITWHDANDWSQFLYPIGVTGLLLFVSTLASWQRSN